VLRDSLCLCRCQGGKHYEKAAPAIGPDRLPLRLLPLLYNQPPYSDGHRPTLARAP